MARRLSVVISQGQSQNPAKRQLEEELVAELFQLRGIEVTVIPHLYDLKPDGTGMLALQGISGDMVVLSWLYPRAAHWVLDRYGIRGQVGQTLLRGLGEDEDDEQTEEQAAEEEEEAKARVAEQQPRPKRSIYCLDLRSQNRPEPFVEEIRRILQESSQQVLELGNWIGGTPRPEQLDRYTEPTNTTALPIAPGAANGSSTAAPESEAEPPVVVQRIDEQPERRWYPVIDFSRCTNCMECIDFCLFGVYGIDQRETIVVEQPDNCRKGCPACSRVCPENAIIFPQHKTPAIAGSLEAVGTLKIDLSQLFGAPDKKESALEAAVRERDEQLVAAGREAVGTSCGVPKRQEGKPQQPKDDLDDLIDALDGLDL